MYAPAEDEAEFSAFGFKPEDYAGDDVAVWPENVQALNLFQFLSTQWRVGMNGYTGLDYGVLYSKMGRMKLTSEDFDLMEADIQAMETAALKAMRESSD